MWTVEYTTCSHCGQEAELLTDGRTALVGGDSPEYIEALGLALIAPCPNLQRFGPVAGDECPGQVHFFGEGIATADPKVEGTVIAR